MRCFVQTHLSVEKARQLTSAVRQHATLVNEYLMPENKTLRWHLKKNILQYCDVKQPLVIPLSISSVYLIPCQGGYLQIDTGYEHDYPAYQKNLARAGVARDSIRYLFLTHHHDDHAGFLNALTRDTDVVILAHEQAVELLQDGRNDTTRGGGYINRFIKLVAGIKMRLDPRWTLTFPPFTLRQSDLLLSGDDNQVLRRLGIAGQVLYTPGHCIDHIAIVLDSGETFCGDAASSFLLRAGTHYCTVFMTDMQSAYQSWQNMLDTGAQVIYPAHGHPFPADKLRQNMGRIKTKDLAS
jgi:hydroxyacylglutathione hydrolase